MGFHGVTDASLPDGGGSGQTCGRLGALVVVKQIGWGEGKDAAVFPGIRLLQEHRLTVPSTQRRSFHPAQHQRIHH